MDQFRRDGEEGVMPFEFEQAGYFADDDVIGLESVARAQSDIVLGVEKGFERKAAEDASVLLRAADARSEILIPHRISNGDKVRGNASGALFSGTEKPVGKVALEISEGGAVDCVNDNRHARLRGSEAAQHARLTAVGVDDVWLPLVE